MKYWTLGVLVAVVVFAIATPISYLALGELYGQPQETYQQQVSITDTAERSAQPTRSSEEGKNVLPMSLGLGGVLSVFTFAVWQGSSMVQQNITSYLLDKDLGDLTVKDLEMIEKMRRMRQFTLPRVMEESETSVSRSTAWRLIQKLSEKELVEEESGVSNTGGRGKPSRVYRYVGP
ncbi:MAG: hypothetical protein ACLFS3_01780 [Candidatus Aenigmatarchaeota archaeon]